MHDRPIWNSFPPASPTVSPPSRRIVVAIGTGRRHVSGILWRPDVVVTSAQTLPERGRFQSPPRRRAIYRARWPGATPAPTSRCCGWRSRSRPPFRPPLPRRASVPWRCSSALTTQERPTGRLAMVHATGPEWHSQAGGRIDALLRLDARLGTDEGGPVLDAAGRLLGMSTAGPRQRALAIPAATIDRVLDPLLAEGRVARGWLGVGLQPVMVPDSLREAAGSGQRHDGGQPRRWRSGRHRGRAAGRHHAGPRRHADAPHAGAGSGDGPGANRPDRDPASAAGWRAADAVGGRSRRGPPDDASRACRCGWP